jgi:hypothetical protein
MYINLPKPRNFHAQPLNEIPNLEQIPHQSSPHFSKKKKKKEKPFLQDTKSKTKKNEKMTNPPPHRRTQNLLLFQKLLALRDGSFSSPFTLVLDTIEQSGKGVVKDIIGNALVCVFDSFFFFFFELIWFGLSWWRCGDVGM